MHAMNTPNFLLPCCRLILNHIKPLLIALGIFISAISFSSQVNAQAPRYTIEVIIFENLALKGWTEERWPDEIELPNTQNSVSLNAPQRSKLAIRTAAPKLTHTADKLSKHYRIIFHKAWSQNAFSPKNTPTILIENDRAGGTSLLGTIKLYKTRFAHVQFDLELEKRIPAKVQNAFAQNQQLDPNDLPSHWRFNLIEKRKIKPGELHYIDHPLFGILVKIQQHN